MFLDFRPLLCTYVLSLLSNRRTTNVLWWWWWWWLWAVAWPPTGLPSRPNGRSSVWLQIVCWQDAGSPLSPPQRHRDIVQTMLFTTRCCLPFSSTLGGWLNVPVTGDRPSKRVRVQSVCRPASPPHTSTAASALMADQHVRATNGHCDVRNDNREKIDF